MIMMFLFPLALLGALVAWLAGVRQARSFVSAPPVTATMLAALVLSYVLSLGIISYAPWYDDNGSREFIAWPYRWAWAAELAGWLAILVVPAALGLRALARAVRQKHGIDRVSETGRE